jgi:cation diffusion facilitator family transporter
MGNKQSLQKLGILTFCVNVGLMLVKIAVGLVGNCYALIADGVESAGDMVTSVVTWGGFHLSLRPADERHPFGHGKIESMAGVFSGLSLVTAATVIVYQAIREITTVHEAPEWYTLPVLIGVVIIKEATSRVVLKASKDVGSVAIKGDAWHHHSDALTSGAAALGITVALCCGPRFAAADEWAALLACAIIYYNGISLLKSAFHELLDGAVTCDMRDFVIGMARGVPDVSSVEKCRVRKSGVDYFVELHLCVPADMTVGEGHALGHRVKDAVMAARDSVRDVVVHLEPAEPSGAD